MSLTEMQIGTALISLSNWSWLISYLAPFLGGENAVLIMAFLFAQEIIPLWTVILFSFLAMITLDSFWFFIVKTEKFSRIKKWQKFSKHSIALEKRIEKISARQDLFILMISKILVGTRILIIIYLGMKKISFKKFFVYNFFPTLVWATMLGLIGWLAGKGYYSISSASHNLFIAGVILAGLIGLLSLASYLLKKWLLKR